MTKIKPSSSLCLIFVKVTSHQLTLGTVTRTLSMEKSNDTKLKEPKVIR